MTSYPMMSNMAHSRHHRNVITSSQPRKRSFIGHMFLSNRSTSNDLLSTPIITADNTAEKSFSLIDNHQINHMNKTTGTSTSTPTPTPTSTSTAPPPPAAAHHASKTAATKLLRSISELSTKSSKWDNFYDSSNVAVSQMRTSSLPTVLQQPNAATLSFDHHHAKTLERIPQTPHFQPTRNLLQDSSNGMVKMMQTLFNPNIRNVS